MTAMTRLKLGQRVTVWACEAIPVGVLHLGRPQSGTVVRLRRCDCGAWVELDERADQCVHPFPPDDNRGRHVLTFPVWCAPLEGGAK